MMENFPAQQFILGEAIGMETLLRLPATIIEAQAPQIRELETLLGETGDAP